jgi:hypothetical protein
MSIPRSEDPETPSEKTTSIDSIPSPEVSLTTGDGQECKLMRRLLELPYFAGP